MNVLPIPTINPVTNYTFCNGQWSSLISFSGTPGSIYNWTNSNPNIGLPFANGTGSIFFMASSNSNSQIISSQITVIPELNGCAGSPEYFTISVNPTPVVYQFDWNYCHGQQTTPVQFQGAFTNVTWTNNNVSIGLVSNGNGNIPSFNAQNLNTSTSIANITAIPTYVNGGTTCTGNAFNFEFHVNPLPTVNAISNISLCQGDSIGTIAFVGSGTSYEWTNSNPGIGLQSNGVGDIPGFIPAVVNNTITTSSIQVTPVYFDYISCYGASENFTITIHTPTQSFDTVSACDSFTLNGETYLQTGTYTQILSNSQGCDSIITLNLTLNNTLNTPTVSLIDDTLLQTPIQDGANYQWILCSDLEPIINETSSDFSPTVNALYAVIVSNSCGSDTSDCIDVNSIGLNEFNQLTIELYPNPNNGYFNVSVPSALIGVKIEIRDINGRILRTFIANEEWQVINISDLASGNYWWAIEKNKPIQMITN